MNKIEIYDWPEHERIVLFSTSFENTGAEITAQLHCILDALSDCGRGPEGSRAWLLALDLPLAE
jgi:hypothetical protein